jgi:pilus assembly protein FimV
MLLACAMLAAAMPAPAAELGEPVVRSYLGQAIIADIELLPDEGGPVSVKLANANVYRGANLAIHPILGSVYFSVMRRDGRQFLHITSVKPNDSEMVPMFLELMERGKPSLRQVTLHFVEDPNPPPPPPPPPPPTLKPEPVERAAEPAPVPPPAPAPAPKPAPRKPAAAPASSRACAELDYKNTQLSAQIVELEEKVKSLQVAVESAQASASAATAAMTAATKPKSAKKKAPEPPPAVNWMLYGGIGGGVLALLGLIVFVLRRRKRAKSGQAKPGFFAHFKKGKKQEPVLEGGGADEPPVET